MQEIIFSIAVAFNKTCEPSLFCFGDQITTRETQAQFFSRFLLQSSKYFLYSNGKRIMLIEEFPNAFIRDPTLLHCILSFNAIAPTLMMKVLTKINNSPKVHSCYKKLSKSEIENIVGDSLGDIRNAINSMQFMCMSYFKKPLSVQGSVSSSEDGSKRDSSLFLFHALGKILYSKRDASKKSNQDVLPTHLKMFEKDPLISYPEEVFDKTSISAEAFTCFCKRIIFPLLMILKLTLNVHIG
nr:cell cycle checkpoint protein RAD17-like isoform X2 [Parasteatoda tepidariorum]